LSTYRIDQQLARSVSDLPLIDRTDIAGARRIYAERITSARRISSGPDVLVTSHTCPGHDGHKIGLRSYRPRRLTTAGAIYHAHGGGFILGDLDMSHQRLVELAREVGALVISVDYRLAPEWPYPTPMEDVYSGLSWMYNHAGDLEIDKSRIVAHGVSAGGGLIAATTLVARDRDGPRPLFQFLASPALDDRLISPSSIRFTDTPALNRVAVQACWSAYLGPLTRGSDAVPPAAAPARMADLGGLPPTYISVAEFDPVRDEGIDYARRLMSAGVPTEVHLFPGTYHGSSAVRDAVVSRRELAEEIAVLTRVLTDDQPQSSEVARTTAPPSARPDLRSSIE
jgi:acetyl esterase